MIFLARQEYTNLILGLNRVREWRILILGGMLMLISIRIIVPDDVDIFWNLRLEALRDHPEAFSADYEESIE